jgi:1-acyl-sn-glycerol-3-phosphate acyltransferase
LLARFRIAAIAAVMICLTLLLAPFQLAAIRWAPRVAGWLPFAWHRLARRLIGLRVTVHGRPPRAAAPRLIVANHVSWADIVVLGSLLPLSFIAKAEVRSWPGANLLARLQNTVFIERHRRGTAGRQAGEIAERLAAGDTMVLFAEGTTGSGHRLLPFKTSLFGAIDAALGQGGHQRLIVQPAAIAYLRLHGLPLGRYHQARAAWPGDLTLLPHLARFLEDGACDAQVVFGEPLVVEAGQDRKLLARTIHERIRRHFSQAMRMRPPE